MPQYTDCFGKKWNIPDWPGGSYKAIVINRAYANSQFAVVDILGTKSVVFQCVWCGKWIGSGAVEGDHVVNQAMGKSKSAEVRGLFEDAEAFEEDDGTPWNLVLSCSECNGGTRNKKKRLSRGDYKKDRDRQGPMEVV